MIPNLQEGLPGNRKWTENRVSEQAKTPASQRYAETKHPSRHTEPAKNRPTNCSQFDQRAHLRLFSRFSLARWSPFPAKAALMATLLNPAPDTDSAITQLPSFESALTELESIVAAMEAGQMPLQDALDAYKRGVALLRQCQETLTAAEQQIRILDANGLREFVPETGAELDD
jgi:exodeoxyribonuclease VII small subunit